MKRYLKFIFLFCFLLLPILKVEALSPSEITSRKECPVIELAEAKEDGSLLKVECYETYQDAKNIMNTTENDNLVIIENGIIIDAKYAVIDYDISYPSGHKGYIDIYKNSTGNTTDGYIRSSTPDDAAMIDYDYNSKRVKIKVSGIIGWINKYDGSLKLYDIVPLSWAVATQYYKVTDSDLIHYFPGNVYGTKTTSSIKIDKKPEMLNVGKYYSYDGNYFYTSMKALLNDYKNNASDQSVNKDYPYYNYYQYVSFRTKTTHPKENIDLYISLRTTNKQSKMLSTGEFFINAQNNYGINAALMVSIGRNESGTGTSSLAINKNNLFGLNAIDKDPNNASSSFASIEDCIINYAYGWLSYGFIHPNDSRFYGANLGNKYQGLNYKYASDPYWAEKAARYYYDLDSMFGFGDRNKYQLAVLNNDYKDVVYAKKTVGGENISSTYQYKKKGSSIVILEEVEGPEVNGNKVWYKIQAEPTLDSNFNYTGSKTSDPRVLYNWDTNYAYVSAAYFNKVNMFSEEVQKPSVDNNNGESNETVQQPEVTPQPVATPVPTPTPTPTPVPTPTPKPISEIVKEANYKKENGNISGIKPSTTVEKIKNNLTKTGGKITITDKDGKVKENGNIGTGDKINITSGTTESLTVLIYGDIDGNGEIDVLDLVALKQHLLGTVSCSGVYLNAANADEQGTIDVIDLVAIKQYLLSK